MSAWIVSPAHIDVLVHGMKRKGVVAMGDSDKTGRTLLAECVRSVSYRYNEPLGNLPGPVPNPKPDEYRYVSPEVELGDHNYAAACSCYSYQSCETPDYEESEAAKLVDELYEKCGGRATESLHGVTHGEDIDLTESSPWGFEDRHVHPNGRAGS